MTGDRRFRDCYFTVEDGLRLHFRDYPGTNDRLPLLCLHGLTRNARDYDEFAERYSPERRVVALDFRGRGESEWDPKPERYMPMVYAGDVIRLLDHLGWAEAIFVGTSLGGLVTMAIAVTEPERIAATILNDIGPELSDSGLERIKGYVGTGARFASLEEAARTIAEDHGHLPTSFTDEDWLRMARKRCVEDGGEIVFQYDQAIAVPFKTAGAAPDIDAWPLFAALTEKPLLAIRGSESDLLSDEAFARMLAASDNVTGATVHGVGHAPMLDEPEAVEAIDAFLRKVD